MSNLQQIILESLLITNKRQQNSRVIRVEHVTALKIDYLDLKYSTPEIRKNNFNFFTQT